MKCRKDMIYSHLNQVSMASFLKFIRADNVINDTLRWSPSYRDTKHSLYYWQHSPPFPWYFKFRFPHIPSTEVFIPRHCIAPSETKGGAIERRIDRIKNEGGYTGHRGSHRCSIDARDSNRFYCISQLPVENEGSAPRPSEGNNRSYTVVINHRISRNIYRSHPMIAHPIGVRLRIDSVYIGDDAATDCTKVEEMRLYRNRVSRTASHNLVYYFLYMHMHGTSIYVRAWGCPPKRCP